MNLNGLRIGLVGPLPPPSGGMANQTQQLATLLESDGANVLLVRTNGEYRPKWTARLRVIRVLFRLCPYLFSLWRAVGQVQLVHVMANSGWSWHLVAAPAIWISSLRGVPAIVNYRGGEAAGFFERSFRWVRPSLRKAAAIVVPSGFLQEIFEKWGISTRIVPNIVDLTRFSSRGKQKLSGDEHYTILVSRNLESIYDVATAIRAFHRVCETLPGVRLIIAGSGPERDSLHALVSTLSLSDSVTFMGNVENEKMAELYKSVDVMVNTSRFDNMPISILEALACGVPVVSTCVGGIPYLVQHNRTALLVNPGDEDATAEAIVSLLTNHDLEQRLVRDGMEQVQQYKWSRVRSQLLDVYESALPINQDYVHDN